MLNYVQAEKFFYLTSKNKLVPSDYRKHMKDKAFNNRKSVWEQRSNYQSLVIRRSGFNINTLSNEHRYSGPVIALINNSLPMARLYKNIYKQITNKCIF